MTIRAAFIATLVLGLAGIGTPGATAPGGQAAKADWTTLFPREPFVTRGANPYFILEPGYTLVLEGRDGRKNAHLTITVLDETVVVDGVETRVVEERELLDGVLYEVSRNFFVLGRTTNSVYYFGEDVDFYQNGQVVDHRGSWRSGIGGARFGVIMPGIFLLGAKYYQEIAPEIALDRAEHVSMTEVVETPAGAFSNVVKVRETTPLEPAARDFKYYAPGVGLVKSNDLVLTRRSTRKP